MLLGEKGLGMVLLLGAPYILFFTLFRYSRKILQGFEKISQASMVKVIFDIGKLVFAVVLVAAGFQAEGGIIGYVLGASVSSLVGLALVYRKYSKTDNVPIETGLRRRIFEYSVPLTITQAAGRLDRRIDTVLVGFFLTPVAVSYYVISKQVVIFVQKPAAALGFTLSPAFAAEKAANNNKKLSKMFELSVVNFLLFYIPAAAGLVLISEPLVTIVFGLKYSGAIPVIQVFSLYLILSSGNRVMANVLDFLGKAKARAYAKGAVSLLNVVLNVALIPRIGVVGAAYSTVAAQMLYAIYNMHLVSSDVSIRYEYVARSMTKILVITSVMTLVVLILRNEITGWISLFIVIAAAVIVWGGLSITAGLLNRQMIPN